MNIANPKDIKIVNGLPPLAKKGDKIAIDTEWFGMEKKRLHRPHGVFAYLGCSFDGKTVYYIDDKDQIGKFLERLELGVWIFANAKFDIRQLRRYAEIPRRRNLWDVILIEQIQYSGYYTDFALNDLVRRYLGIYLPKEQRDEFSAPMEEFGDNYRMTSEMIGYASLDVAYTWQVFQAQREKISEDDLSIWRTIELPFMWTILSMGGVKLDVNAWLKLAKENRDKADAIQAKYGYSEIVCGPRGGKKEIFVGLNLNSNLQVKKQFYEWGINLKSTDADALEEIVARLDHGKVYDFAKEMLEYRKYAKRASTYGEKFITDHVEADGKIYADIYQIGAETGRTSCRAPNLQNQPHDPKYRECYIVDNDDEVIIVADWGSQEPRIAAFLSEDEGLADALNSDEKLYVRVARDILNISITKQDEEYKHMKSTVLGIFYGMSAKGLAAQIGVDEDVAEHYIESFLETYPGVKNYMQKQKRARDYVTSIYGRKIWLNKYSYQWERNALNAPIQSSAADAMKLAASYFVELNHPKWELVLLVHDEIAIKVPKEECDTATEVLNGIMIDVAEKMHEGISGSVEIFSGSNWACKS